MDSMEVIGCVSDPSEASDPHLALIIDAIALIQADWQFRLKHVLPRLGSGHGFLASAGGLSSSLLADKMEVAFLCH
ncbi:hypothetical protein IMY05_010G0105800 [Salix suchowensis]|nr:hypothetical protein IMY05_010G0105800 [Salix suchowensis]